jgi:iron complex outermembrane receptor protein
LALNAAFASPVADDDELALVYGAGDSVSIATGNLQALRRAPAVATVITAADIAAMGATDLDQILESVPASTSTARPTAIRRCTWCAASSAPIRRRS